LTIFLQIFFIKIKRNFPLFSSCFIGLRFFMWNWKVRWTFLQLLKIKEYSWQFRNRKIRSELSISGTSTHFPRFKLINVIILSRLMWLCFSQKLIVILFWYFGENFFTIKFQISVNHHFGLSCVFVIFWISNEQMDFTCNFFAFIKRM
jgi:hypothetical protein